MRYTLDENGYVKCVLWGGMSGDCQEYTGEVPAGYSSLADWAENACINAYYIENGNLVLDSLRQSNLQLLYEQQAIDYSPVLHKDLFETHEIIDAQYKKNTVRGLINVIEDARSLAPMVRVDGLTADKITIFSQSKNMLPINFKSETKGGLTFTAGSGYFSISGTATEDVEYTIAGGGTDPIFALLSGYNYRLEIGSCSCEMLYFDGEKTQQVYSGSGGTISLSEDKAVTQIKLKISSGTTMNETIWPTLSFSGTTLTSDDAQGEVRSYTIDLSGYDLVSSAYVLIGGGLAALYSGGATHVLRSDNLRLLNGYNMIYTDHENYLEITYTSNELQVDDMAFLQGKATTTKKFMILEDGSIVATNGSFSGEVTCTKLIVSEGATVEGIDTGITASQATQITKDTIRTGSLTANDLTLVGGGVNITADSSLDVIIIKSSDYVFGSSGYAAVMRGGGFHILAPGTLAGRAAHVPVASLIPDSSGNGILTVTGLIKEGGEYLYQRYASTDHSHSGLDGSYSNIYANQIYFKSPVTASVDAVYRSTGTGNRLGTSSSLRKYKNSIGDVTDDSLLPERLYDLPVRQFKWNRDVIGTEYDYEQYSIGFIAEEVDEIYPRAAIYRDGELASWSERNMIPAMLQLIQDQKKEIEALKLRIEKLEEAIK